MFLNQLQLLELIILNVPTPLPIYDLYRKLYQNVVQSYHQYNVDPTEKLFDFQKWVSFRNLLGSANATAVAKITIIIAKIQYFNDLAEEFLFVSVGNEFDRWHRLVNLISPSRIGCRFNSSFFVDVSYFLESQLSGQIPMVFV
ncbi:hypothetical protein DERF_013577 [Dermatophagoides farinae]|uniref:Uncharacterized protein n=1 Tax=Dermatophagoides farinae TaxID=6954 RepID=A0A922HMN5_DERFA|nr:hypothetical protein DERF_013577 [Dermatophagoides farinae]